MVEIDNKKMWKAIEKLLDVADAIKVSLNKQGLQWNGKEIVNIKPKFKVGDWIVGANNVFKIIALNNKLNCYIAITQNNEKAAKIPYYLDDGQGHMCSYHLWTIQDAKDGDILVSGKEKRPFIFKGLLDELHPNNPVAYCGIDCGDRFIVTAGTVQWTDKEIEPATKEQYDLLFSKMKEADYEWDVEQKTNSQCVTSAKAKEALLLDDELTEFENESQSISLDKTINWDEIRIQAAIAAMKGMLANAALVDDAQLDYRITIEQAAVSYANTLVEELKKKE